MRRAGWERLSRPGCKLSARWMHTDSRWLVRHCGHPTANWPYFAVAPDPSPAELVTSFTGRGFRTLTNAFETIEAHLRGELKLYEDGVTKHGHRWVLADPDHLPPWLLAVLSLRTTEGALPT